MTWLNIGDKVVDIGGEFGTIAETRVDHGYEDTEFYLVNWNDGTVSWREMDYLLATDGIENPWQNEGNN